MLPITVYAQPCPTDLDIYATVEEEDCGVMVTIHFDSDTWSTSTTLEVEDMQVEFGIGLTSGSLAITDLGFVDEFGTMSLSGTSLTNNGNDIEIEHNPSNTDMPTDEITGPQVWFFIEGGAASDFVSIVRNNGSLNIDYDGGPAGCGATSSPSGTTFTIESNSIEGHIEAVGAGYSTCSSLDIEGADVVINPGFFEICSTTSDSDGDYQCNTCEDGPYLVCVSAQCDDGCGLSSADLTQGQQALLFGYTDFYIDIAGDVDRNGVFNSSDLALISKEIDGDNPDVDWCRFIPIPEYAAQNISASNCTTVPRFANKFDFYRIAIGDFNGSCNDCIHKDLMGDFPIVMEENDGGVEIYVSDDIQLIGLDLHLSVPNVISSHQIKATHPLIKTSSQKSGMQISYWDFSDDMAGISISAKEPIISLPGLTLDDISLNVSESSVISTHSGAFYIDHILNKTDRRSLDVNFFSSRESTLLPSDMTSSELSLEIYSTGGAIVYRRDVPAMANTIQVNKIIPTGIYLMTFRSDDAIHTEKIWIR